MTLVSIGLPVYNGEKFLAEALDSILSQSFEDFELIISDNASTDRTGQICAEYAAKDRRIRYINGKRNLGAAPNFNRVFEMSTGKYFKWLAADDVCGSDFLTQCLEALNSSNDAVLAYPRIIVFDENGNRASYKNVVDQKVNEPHRRLFDILADKQCFPIFGLIRTEVLRKTGLIRSMRSGDKMLLAELSLYGRLLEVEEYLFFRRDHSNTSYYVMKQAGDYANQMKANVKWFDSSKGKRYPLTNLQICRECVRAVKRSELSRREKIQCYGTIAKWSRKNARGIAGDVKVALTEYFKGR